MLSLVSRVDNRPQTRLSIHIAAKTADLGVLTSVGLVIVVGGEDEPVTPILLETLLVVLVPFVGVVENTSAPGTEDVGVSTTIIIKQFGPHHSEWVPDRHNVVFE